MRPLRIWCVSDGRAGIERQTLALADALAERVPVEQTVLRLTPRPPQVWLPPRLWPAPLSALPGDQRALLVPPWPDVWIGNGRRSIPYSLLVRRRAGWRTVVVQAQDPRVPARLFDLVVPPLHDAVTGPCVHATIGAPVWHGEAAIAAARAAFPDLAGDPAPRVLVVIGGPTPRHAMTLERVAAILADLRHVAGQGGRLWITTSRRTPGPVVAQCRELARETGARMFASEQEDGPNPYLAWLASADAALVTEESTSMLSDAAFFGLPIHLLKLEGGDARFARLHQSLVNRGAARWFEGQVARWTYPPVRDAADVAATILRLVEARGAWEAQG